MKSFTEDLRRAMGIIVYQGCRIIPQNGKFIALYHECDTVEEAKQRIDRAFVVLNKITIIK